MSQAIPLSEKDWQQGMKIVNNTAQFNYMTRPFIIKQCIAAQKVSVAEFLFKLKK